MSNQSFHKLGLIGLIMAGAASLATPAGATLTLTSYDLAYDSHSDPAKQAKIVYNPSGSSNDKTVTTKVGEFELTIYDSATKISTDYLSYCVDIYQYIQTGSVSNGPWYTMSTLSTSSKLNGVTIGQAEFNELNALIANTQSLVTDASHSAAVQMAIWDIIYDRTLDNATGTKNYAGSHSIDYLTLSGNNNYDGLFTVSGSNISTTVGLANSYVKNVTTGIWKPSANYSLSVLSSDKMQDQLIWTYAQHSQGSPTPEPATWATMVLGFGAIGHGLRRRKARRMADATA